MKARFRFVELWMCAFLAFSLVTDFQSSAQESLPAKGKAGGDMKLLESREPVSVRASVATSYSFGGQAHFKGASGGDSDASALFFKVEDAARISDKWSATFGLESKNFFLRQVPGTPVPSKINTLGFGAGVEYRQSREWVFLASAGPALGKYDDVSTTDISVVGYFAGVWNPNPSVTAFFGLAVSTDGRVPVFPVVGVDWRINQSYELNATFPKLWMIYHQNQKLSFHSGVEFVLADFRTGKLSGTQIGLAKYNDALGSYQEVRLGCGVEYRIDHRWSFLADAGYSISRQIDFQRIHEHVRFYPAPYVSCGIRAAF
jgi:hypothetical protein